MASAEDAVTDSEAAMVTKLTLIVRSSLLKNFPG